MIAGMLCPDCGEPTKAPNQQQQWQCKARNTHNTDWAVDCEWPECGCDPQTAKIVEHLVEIGWQPPDPERVVDGE